MSPLTQVDRPGIDFYIHVDQKHVRSCSGAGKMEQRWTSGAIRNPAHNISAQYLASSANIFSSSFIRNLSNDLESSREQLARELGLSTKNSTADELYSWCNSPGSTVFVLISVLANLGRNDCVNKIEQYFCHQTMQLFVKVEEAASDHRATTGNLLLHQIITSCEFNLLQALENVMGDDIVCYAIVGPGSWVTWQTSVSELKGQQLTLFHHNQPVPATRSALSDTKESNTEPKKPEVSPNVPTQNYTTRNDKTFLKTNQCTEMESLKYSPETSNQISNSNNISLSGSQDLEKEKLHYLSADGPPKTLSHPSVGFNNSVCTSDPQTQVKELISDKENTPEYAPVVKHFPDKLLYNDDDDKSKPNNPDVLIHQALDNVPNLSLLNAELSSLLPNIQGETTRTPEDNKSKTETQIHNKILIGSSNQNTTEYSKGIKHLPEKILNKDFNSTDDKECLKTIQHAIDNVPHLSLFEVELSSLVPDSKQLNLPATFQEKQDKLNNLSCGTAISTRTSMVPRTFLKTFGSEDRQPVVDIKPAYSHMQSWGLNQQNNVDSNSELGLAETEMHYTACSMLPLGNNFQQISVATGLASHGYFLKSMSDKAERQIQNMVSPIENDSPLLCDNLSVVSIPPQKKHRLGFETSTSNISEDQQLHHELPQQTLLDVQAIKLKQLQIQQLKQQLISQQALDSDFTDNSDDGQEPPWPQIKNQICQDTELHHHQQQIIYTDQNPQGKIIQRVVTTHQDMQNETMSSVQQLQQQLPQQLKQQTQNEPHQKSQSSDSPFPQTKLSPFLNSNASPYLICHTPPPGFPEDQNASPEEHTNNNHNMMSEKPDMLSKESQVFEVNFPKSETNPSHHFIGKLGHATKINTKDYMTMGPPGQTNFVNPMKQNNYFEQFITVQNTEFPDTNFGNPFLSCGKHRQSMSRSDSSGISADCPTTFQGDSSSLFLGGQNVFTTPQPFYPAPPIFDALGRRINYSVTNSNDFLRTEAGKVNLPYQDGYSYVDNRPFPVGRSFCSNQSQNVSMTNNMNSKLELLQLEGWCEHENGDTIKQTMEKFKSQDGNYIIWKSRRFKKLIISVSHLNQLFHFRVEVKCESNDQTLYYLFEGGYKSTSLLGLIQHYRQKGIRISMQSRGSNKTYIEQIHLRFPLKVKLEAKKKGHY